MRGSDPGQFEDPIGPAIDPSGRLYFADRVTGFVQKFETSGVPLLTFETPAAKSADSIAVDSGGAIYLANARTGAIQIFFPEGDPLRALRTSPQPRLDSPFIFSIDPNGRIYVPDPAGARIHVLSSKGLLLKIWKVPPSNAGKPARPFAAVAEGDTLYVGDSTDGRILKFTGDGALTAEFKTDLADPAADALPVSALAAVGKHVFALRGLPPRLEIWSDSGHLEAIDTLENRLSAVKSAAYLAADAAGDLVIFDPEARRVLRFRLHLDLP